MREDFWFIVVTEGNEDETEIRKFERPGRETGSGHPRQDTEGFKRYLEASQSGDVLPPTACAMSEIILKPGPP